MFFRLVKSVDLVNVKRLIENGADINAQDNYGLTALRSASDMGHTEVAQLLREAGAEGKEFHRPPK